MSPNIHPYIMFCTGKVFMIICNAETERSLKFEGHLSRQEGWHSLVD